MTEQSRVTAGLIPNGEHSLIELTERTGLCRADVINRALQLYRFVFREQSAGSRFTVVRADGTEDWVEIR